MKFLSLSKHLLTHCDMYTKYQKCDYAAELDTHGLDSLTKVDSPFSLILIAKAVVSAVETIGPVLTH